VIRRIILLVGLCALSACHSFKEVRFANFELAMQMAPTSDTQPPVYDGKQLPSQLPPGVGYAALEGNFEGSSSLEWRARSLRNQIKRLGFRPDYILIMDGGHQSVGAVSNYVGYGMTMATPMYRSYASGLCVRLAPSSLGISWDSNSMVVSVSDEARAQVGIQEGDTIINIGGHSVKVDPGRAMSDFQSMRLSYKSGDSAEVVWIRPGEGRLSGTATFGPPSAGEFPPSTFVLDRR